MTALDGSGTVISTESSKVSGRRDDRPGPATCLKALRQGDTFGALPSGLRKDDGLDGMWVVSRGG